MKFDFHKNHKLLYGTVFFGFLALSILISVAPAFWVQANNQPLPGMMPLSDIEKQGMAVYVAEGCIACHTQQVRPLDQDLPYGRPSSPGDYAFVERPDVWRTTPALLGTQRTGPDLINVGSRQPSDVWQYMHLYNPRSVVPESVMPAYPWLFDVKAELADGETAVPLPEQFAPAEGFVVPNEKGAALVAYMLALKQVPIEGDATAGGSSPVAASAGAAAPAPAGVDNLPAGEPLYTAHCAACHQAQGQGLPGAFPPLAGNDVVLDDDATEHIDIILHGLTGKTIDGVDYSSPMPAFPQLSDEQIAAIVNHERTSWGNAAPTVTSDDVATVRSAGGTP
jgi:cytochrome c oxidase cbb3-type subunit 2